MSHIDLNCDMGEGMPYDAELMPFISSANIACGYHAGDALIMEQTVDLAILNKVAIGAHPGFNDREHFGRKEILLPQNTLYSLVTAQILLLYNLCLDKGTRLHHVKAHGALYNMAARDPDIAYTIARAVKDVDDSLILYGLSGSEQIHIAHQLNLKTASEVFADRTYQDNGSLTARQQPNALITDENKCIQQVIGMIKDHTVNSVSGKAVHIVAETVCIHGDGEHAVAFASKIYQTLQQQSIEIKAV